MELLRDDRLRDEIFALLELARQNDPEFKLFGASMHRYALNPPIDPKELGRIQDRYGVVLPEDYFWFMTRVGNGGAGPYYGLYGIWTSPQDEWRVRSWLEYARADPLELPIGSEAWKALVDGIDTKEDSGDLQEDDLYRKCLFGGMVDIATQGNPYDIMILLRGKDAGRVVYTDLGGLNPSVFPPYGGSTFLEWYMGWLNEAASGYSCDEYGYMRLGTPDEILAGYGSEDENGKVECLRSILKARKEGRRLPKQGPGLSETAQARLCQIYADCTANRDIVGKRDNVTMAALGAMAHFNVGDWEAQAMELMPGPEWTEGILLLLVRTLGYRLENAPDPDIWYKALVSSLPTAFESGSAWALERIAALAAACGCFRFEDFLPFAEGKWRAGLLRAICEKRPVPDGHLPLFFGCISDSLQGFWDLRQSGKHREAVSCLRDAGSLILALLDNTPECKSQMQALYLGQLEKAQKELGSNTFDALGATDDASASSFLGRIQDALKGKGA